MCRTQAAIGPLGAPRIHSQLQAISPNDPWSGGLIYLNDGSANFSRATIRMNDNGVLGKYTHPHLGWDINGNGSIQRLPLDILVGDVDNDGDIDLVAPKDTPVGSGPRFSTSALEPRLLSKSS